MWQYDRGYDNKQSEHDSTDHSGSIVSVGHFGVEEVATAETMSLERGAA